MRKRNIILLLSILLLSIILIIITIILNSQKKYSPVLENIITADAYAVQDQALI